MARVKLGLALIAALMAASAMAVPPALADDRDGTAWKKVRSTDQQASKRQKKPAAPAVEEEEAPPRSISNLTNSKQLSKAVTETEIVAGRDERPMLNFGSGTAMQDAVARYEIIVARGGWPRVSPAKLKVGVENKGVIPIKRRLAAEGFYPTNYADHPLVTANFIQAIRQFQINYGLAANGALDKATLAAMNVSAEQRLATLRANLPRLAEYGKDLGHRYILVNIPALQLEAVNGTEVFSRHNIIVGKPDRPSPVVMTNLSDINFNPYWNAPVSIVEKDIIPEVRRKGTGVLKQMGIRLFEGYSGPEVDPDTVDWDSLAAERYFFRQDPGEENAMAAVKINFPSPFGVYMHDTPTRSLFTSGSRYLSSGCVRVDKVQILVDWILNGQDGWNPIRIADVATSEERLDVKLVDPPQIRWVYLTAWVSGNGQANFRKDIYDLDGSGFVMGQPTPVGEYAEDGQRFFLKAPVKQAAIAPADDAEEPSLLKKASLVAEEPEEDEPVVVRKSFGRKWEPKRRVVNGTTAAKAKPKRTAALSSQELQPKKNNFNRPPEAKSKAKPVAKKPVPSKKPVAGKKPEEAKKLAAVKPGDAKKSATAKKPAAADKKVVAEKKPAAKQPPVPAAKPVKKKKPLQNTTTAESGTPVFGAQ